MTVKAYLLSVPERFVRSALGLGAGAARELGEVALPDGIRRSQLYQNLVDATLRYLIEQVGGVEGVYSAAGTLPADFLARRTAGNAVEVLGIVAFRASPVWVLAALADLCGLGRHLIPEMADALKAQGLLDKDAQFTSVDQMLDGLERTASRLAGTINTPPLDVAGLRTEWEAIRDEARRLPPASLPSRDTISSVWAQLKTESARQDRSVFETSSMMAVAAVRALPDGVRWLSATAQVGAMRTSHVIAAALLDHYTQTLSEIQQVGYLAYAGRQFRPYVRAAVDQFSPKRRTLTQRLLEKVQSIRSAKGKRPGGTELKPDRQAAAKAPMPIVIREATADDVPALARVHVQTFNQAHRGGQSGGPSQDLRERQWQEAFASTDGRWFCFVAEDKSGEIIGFAKGTPHDGGVPGFAGELNKIYVLRRLHRQGVGRLLLCHVAHRFLQQGVTSMLLFGEATNPSNGFYEVFGAERLYSETGEFHGGYGWRDLHALVARCGGG